MAGHIDIMIDLAPNSLPHVRAGAIKAYSVMAKTRLGAAPGIPTVDEAGLPGFYMSAWQAVWVPKGTPMSVIGMLQVDCGCLGRPTVRLADLRPGSFPRTADTQALGALQKAEFEKWWPTASAHSGIKAGAGKTAWCPGAASSVPAHTPCQRTRSPRHRPKPPAWPIATKLQPGIAHSSATPILCWT